MATYVVLFNFTDQGIGTVRYTVDLATRDPNSSKTSTACAWRTSTGRGGALRRHRGDSPGSG
jgi:hypothetical protein